MGPIDYRQMVGLLNMLQPVVDNPFSRRNAVNRQMGLEGAGGPRQGGGGGREVITPGNAAMKYKGKVYIANNHVDAAQKAATETKTPLDRVFEQSLEGFQTSSGRFVLRDEAAGMMGIKPRWGSLHSVDIINPRK